MCWSYGIISENDILTNAVCSSACRLPSNCKVYVGRVNVNSGGTQVKIINTVWHESYVEMNMIQPLASVISVLDIGIIHTDKIPLSRTVEIVELPKRNFSQSLLIFSGWGAERADDFEGSEPRVR